MFALWWEWGSVMCKQTSTTIIQAHFTCYDEFCCALEWDESVQTLHGQLIQNLTQRGFTPITNRVCQGRGLWHRGVVCITLVASLMSLMASLLTTSRIQQCFNVLIDICHEFLSLFYCCVLLEIKRTTTTTTPTTTTTTTTTTTITTTTTTTTITTCFNTSRPEQNGRHFPDDIFKYIFLNDNV